MNFIGYVYKIYCLITQKNYIGITTQSIDRRWDQHKNESIGETGLNLNHFHLAIRKYGWDNFEKTILLKIESDTKEHLIESLKQLEVFYIEKYNSYKNGYNSTIGGEGIITDLNNKKVLVFNELGQFLDTCSSRVEAAKKYNVLASNVGECCNRIIQSSGWKNNLRLIFRNEDDIVTQEDLNRIKKARKNQPVPVKCYDFNTGELLGEYESIVQAERETGIDSDSISKCSLYKTKSTIQGGRKLVWRKLSDTYEPKYKIEAFIDNKSIGKYVSIANAADIYNLNPSHISEYLSGKRKTGGYYLGKPIIWVKL